MPATTEYKCPCCGGAIEFNSASQKMKCPYCDTEFDLETLKSYDEALYEDQPDEMEWNSENEAEWDDGSMNMYICESCGGEIISDENTAATSCPYCGNPVILNGRLSGTLKPDIVIPFKLDKKAAKEALANHFKGKRLLPKVFKDENHLDEIKGVYVPFWLFDCDTDANINYRATRLRHWSDHRYEYTETSHFLATRAGDIGFQNVPVDGSSKMPNDLMESIEPFDINEAVDFQTAYLSGFLADKYDVSSEESMPRANERVKNSTEQAFADTVVGYTTVVPQNSNIHLSNGKVRYALYPVWLLNTSWKDQKFLFAMNGQTGKFVGDLPMDKGAFWRWFFAIFGITAIIVGVIFGFLTL